MPLIFNGTEIGTMKMGTTEINTTKFGSTDVYNSFKYLIPLNNSNASENIPSDIYKFTKDTQLYNCAYYINGTFYKYLLVGNFYQYNSSKLYIYKLGKNDSKWIKTKETTDMSLIDKKMSLYSTDYWSNGRRPSATQPFGKNNHCLYNDEKLAFISGGYPFKVQRFDDSGRYRSAHVLDTNVNNQNPLILRLIDPSTLNKTEKSITLKNFPNSSYILDQYNTINEPNGQSDRFLHTIYYDRFSMKTYAIVTAITNYYFSTRYNTYTSNGSWIDSFTATKKLYLAHFANETSNSVELIYDQTIEEMSTNNSKSYRYVPNSICDTVKVITTIQKDYDVIFLIMASYENSGSENVIELRFTNSGVTVYKTAIPYRGSSNDNSLGSYGCTHLIFDEYGGKLCATYMEYVSHTQDLSSSQIQGLNNGNSHFANYVAGSGWYKITSTFSLFGKTWGKYITDNSTSYLNPTCGLFDNVFDNKDCCIVTGPYINSGDSNWFNDNKCLNIILNNDGSYKTHLIKT